jgi:MYXO-CTERM domain-containing protein
MHLLHTHLKPLRLALPLALAVGASAATSQVVMATRDSQVNASWIAGYANQIFGGGGQDADGNLFAIDGIKLQGADTAAGYYPPTNVHWNAGFSWGVEHRYLVDGVGGSVLDAATKITASGLTTTSSAVSAPATGTLQSLLPGNLLALSFVNPVEQTFLFQGNVAQQGPFNRNYSDIRIVRDDGTPINVQGWQHNGGFHQLVTLPGGIYSIVATAVSHASQNESAYASWDYSFEWVSAVPEPGAWALWMAGLGVLGALQRRRRAA